MRRLVRDLPSPPMAVALLALFVARGDSAYAIGSAKDPKNSVVAKSIKTGAVTHGTSELKSTQIGAYAICAST
jgi:hypothetical protein